MDTRKNTEAFLEALKNPYFHNTANVSTDYLRGECRLLSFLAQNTEKAFQSGELAKLLGFTTPRIASTLKSLEKKNLIKRSVSENDKRRVYVSITEEGISYIEGKRENVCLFFDGIFGKMTQEECSEFIRLITKICEIGEQLDD
jgi:DNA-binding MarR family transcriptional regulator